MTYGPLKKQLSDRQPDQAEDVPTYLKREALPAMKEMRKAIGAIADALDSGGLVLAGYRFFVDPADGKLKAEGPSHTITVVAIP